MKTFTRAKFGFLWVTLLFFIISFIGHWTFAWFSYVSEQEEHGAEIEIKGYLNETLRDTFENWQSEFLQLMWQVAGLTYLLYIGSPQSREGDERKEEKLDAILELLDPKEGKKIQKDLEKKYPKG